MELQPTITFSLMNPDGMMNYSIFVGNSSNNCTDLLVNVSGVGNGSYYFNDYYSANNYETRYWFAINVSDSDSMLNESFCFTCVRGGGQMVSTPGFELSVFLVSCLGLCVYLMFRKRRMVTTKK